MRALGHRLTTAALALLLLLAALATIQVPAAGASPSAADPAPQARWTVMVYMDGDNNLEPWITHDIDKEMAAVGSSAEVQVIALADRGAHPGAADGGWKGARVFRVTKGMHATADQAIADWGKADMGSPQTLTDFVTWTKAAYPADHYALMMWDHGWGWWPGNTMKDVTSNDYLDMNELRTALQTFGGVDMAGMETCLGQTIEVQAEFRGFADALAGSEDSTGYTTFDYEDVLGRLQADPRMTAAQLAIAAARSIRNGHDQWSLTGSAVTLDWRWDRLAAAVSDLGWDLAVRLPGDRAELGAARHAAASPPQATPRYAISSGSPGRSRRARRPGPSGATATRCCAGRAAACCTNGVPKPRARCTGRPSTGPPARGALRCSPSGSHSGTTSRSSRSPVSPIGGTSSPSGPGDVAAWRLPL